jgi:hypothetical protein
LASSGISAGLGASLSHLSHSLQHLANQPGKKTVTVVKFWLQCTKNMLAVAPGEVVAGHLWQQLLQLTLTAFKELEQGRWAQQGQPTIPLQYTVVLDLSD